MLDALFVCIITNFCFAENRKCAFGAIFGGPKFGASLIHSPRTACARDCPANHRCIHYSWTQLCFVFILHHVLFFTSIPPHPPTHTHTLLHVWLFSCVSPLVLCRSHAIDCSSTIVQTPVQSGSCLLANHCHQAWQSRTGNDGKV